jgi:hypothetical protein
VAGVRCCADVEAVFRGADTNTEVTNTEDTNTEVTNTGDTNTDGVGSGSGSTTSGGKFVSWWLADQHPTAQAGSSGSGGVGGGGDGGDGSVTGQAGGVADPTSLASGRSEAALQKLDFTFGVVGVAVLALACIVLVLHKWHMGATATATSAMSSRNSEQALDWTGSLPRGRDVADVAARPHSVPISVDDDLSSMWEDPLF